MHRSCRSILLMAALAAGPALADPPVIEAVEARASAGTWTFSVTISHGDTGWDDYADGWEVLSPDGSVLGTRTLLHPHVDEQPFTRSLSGVAIPEDLDRVFIHARTKPDGWSPDKVAVPLNR